MFPLSLVLVVSLAFSVEYSKGQSITDVSKFTTQSDIGTEEEPTINDDTEEEEIIEDDETEPEPTDEEDNNDTVASVPPKRPFGTDLVLKNLTGVQIEDGSPNATVDKRPGVGKLIFGSCQKSFPEPITPRGINYGDLIRCNVPGASPGDNVVVSSTALDVWACNVVAASKVSEPNVVSILVFRGIHGTGWAGGHDHGTITGYRNDHTHSISCGPDVSGTVIFSIIVFKPLQDIVPSEELQRNDPLTFPLR